MPRHNDLCPCGSGKKYKRCCALRVQVTELRSAQTRDCGSCTACCDGWLRINIHGHAVHSGKPCPYSTGHSCTIYENRPQHPCREFVCGWLEADSPLPEEFRPDKIGVIFVRNKWRGEPIYVLTEAGRELSGEVLEWAKQFSLRSKRPFLYQHNGEWYAFGPPEFQHEILKKAAENGHLFN